MKCWHPENCPLLTNRKCEGKHSQSELYEEMKNIDWLSNCADLEQAKPKISFIIDEAFRIGKDEA